MNSRTIVSTLPGIRQGLPLPRVVVDLERAGASGGTGHRPSDEEMVEELDRQDADEGHVVPEPRRAPASAFAHQLLDWASIEIAGPGDRPLREQLLHVIQGGLAEEALRVRGAVRLLGPPDDRGG